MAISLIREMHTALTQLNKTRKDYLSGKLQDKDCKNLIGLFNTTSRAVDVTLKLEKWNKMKSRKKG